MIKPCQQTVRSRIEVIEEEGAILIGCGGFRVLIAEPQPNFRGWLSVRADDPAAKTCGRYQCEAQWRRVPINVDRPPEGRAERRHKPGLLGERHIFARFHAADAKGS